MANRIYRSYLQALGEGLALDLLTADIRGVLCDSEEYTPDTTVDGDEFLSDIPAGARVSLTGALANKTWVDAILNADDLALPDTGGDEAEYLALFVHTGTDATARLLALIDTATGLPVTPDSVEDTVQWAAGGIFGL